MEEEVVGKQELSPRYICPLTQRTEVLMVDEASLPGLNSRAQGWLRYIWDKATTEDDWTSKGEPLPWWDKTTTPPMCSFPRFDLSETSYSLPLMADQTPAWREIYTRIADELVGRYTTFWAAADWLTLIGPDPNRIDIHLIGCLDA